MTEDQAQDNQDETGTDEVVEVTPPAEIKPAKTRQTNIVEGARGSKTRVKSTDVPGRPSGSQDKPEPRHLKNEERIFRNAKGQEIIKTIGVWRSKNAVIRRTISVRKAGSKKK